MTTLDPFTGQPLPPDAIQRVLYITPKVHVYAIPPLTSNKGHVAAVWTRDQPIFTARVRILETAKPTRATGTGSPGDSVQVAILLEDGSTGELFAAAPYNQTTVAEQAIDSSRFFAVRVVGEGGRKATLGIGFEERSDAFDFGITLQDASKVLGLAKSGVAAGERGGTVQAAQAPKTDYSLKEGQTITVNLASNHKRVMEQGGTEDVSGGSLFAVRPPPGYGTSSAWLPPPPGTKNVEHNTRRQELEYDTTVSTDGKTAEELGFDDGEFGEFQ